MVNMTVPIGAILVLASVIGACSAVVQQPKRVSALENTHEVDASTPLSLSHLSYRGECWLKRPVRVSARAAALFQKVEPTHGGSKGKPNHVAGVSRKIKHSSGDAKAKPSHRWVALHGKQDPHDGDTDAEDDWDTSELEGDDDGDAEDDWDTSELDGDSDGDGAAQPPQQEKTTKKQQKQVDTAAPATAPPAVTDAPPAVTEAAPAPATNEVEPHYEVEGGGGETYDSTEESEGDDVETEVDPCEIEGPERPESCDELVATPASAPPPLKPFETVLKDGFMRVSCIKDFMYYHGDKYGDGKFAYKLGRNYGNGTFDKSIVRYETVVAKEDQKEMTPSVCFEFCRTVPDMGFFGLLNGRTCYCTPYFQSMASDSSMCDAACPGDPTNMCGGKSKSSLYEMHNCNSAEKDLKAAVDGATLLANTMGANFAAAKTLSAEMQKAAENLQKSFGNVGDSAAAGLMQDAKVFAGEVQHQAEAVEALSNELTALVGKSGGVDGSVRGSEALTETLDKALVAGSDAAEKLAVLMEAATSLGNDTDRSLGSAKQYYPLLYFVNKDFVNLPSTCGGDSVRTPMGDMSLDDCAYACDENVGTCVGFSFYSQEKLCFLMSKFTSAFYYTGCKTAAQEPAFLQQRRNAEVTCMAKFIDFKGTTLKPDPSGKCKQCLKTITKADRCFE